MNQLQSLDPEFYNYLAKNDANLLNFASSELALNSPIHEEEEEVLEGHDEKTGLPRKQQSLERIARKATSGSLLNLRKLYALFRRMANSTFSVDKNEEEEGFEENFLDDTNLSLTVERISIILSASFLGLCSALQVTPSQDLSFLLEKFRCDKQSKSIKSLLESLFKTAIKVLQSLNFNNSHHVDFFLKLIPLLRNHHFLFISLPVSLRSYTKVLLHIWLDVLLIQNYVCFTNVNSALMDLSSLMSANHIAGVEELLKVIYHSFIKLARDVHDSAIITQALEAVVHLYGSNLSAAYQQTFLYVRQLSLHLRVASLRKGDNSLKTVKSWEYLWSLRLWTRMVIQLSKLEGGFRMFAFPLSQILIGACKLVSSVYFLPFRLHLLHELQLIAAAFELFLPTNKLLVEMVASLLKIFENPTKSVSNLIFDFNSVVAFPNNSLESPSIRTAAFDQVLRAVRSEIKIYEGFSSAHAHLFLLVRKLRSASKKLQDSRHQKLIKALINHIIAGTDSAGDIKVEVEIDQISRSLSDKESIDKSSSDEVPSKLQKEGDLTGEHERRKKKQRTTYHKNDTDKVSQLIF